MNRRIKQAFHDYLSGADDGWGLLEVVQSEGYEGFEVDKDMRLILKEYKA